MPGTVTDSAVTPPPYPRARSPATLMGGGGGGGGAGAPSSTGQLLAAAEAGESGGEGAEEEADYLEEKDFNEDIVLEEEEELLEQGCGLLLSSLSPLSWHSKRASSCCYSSCFLHHRLLLLLLFCCLLLAPNGVTARHSCLRFDGSLGASSLPSLAALQRRPCWRGWHPSHIRADPPEGPPRLWRRAAAREERNSDSAVSSSRKAEWPAPRAVSLCRPACWSSGPATKKFLELLLRDLLVPVPRTSRTPWLHPRRARPCLGGWYGLGKCSAQQGTDHRFHHRFQLLFHFLLVRCCPLQVCADDPGLHR